MPRSRRPSSPAFTLPAALLAVVAPFVLAPLMLVPAGPARAADPEPAAAVAAIVPTVTVTRATVSPVQQRVPVSGTLVARAEVQVYPQVSGYEINELLVEVGDRVTAGQPLARLSDTTLRAQLAQAEAELARASAAIAQAESQIASADAAAAQAQSALDRTQRLNRSGNTTQAVLDEAIAANASATAAAASARGGLEVAQAGLAQAEAARGIAQLNLDRATITSPADGIITERNATRGALSGGSAEPMFRLIADGEVEMQGEILETALGGLEVGDPALLTVAGVGEVRGQVRLIPASVDPVTRLGIVRVALDPDDRLRPGLFSTGWIVLDERDAVTVPSTAVLTDGDGERVQVVRDGRVEARPVRAGVLWDGRREIVEGLDEGEPVLLRAGAFFRDGDPVNAVAEGPAPSDAAPVAAADTPAAQAGATGGPRAEASGAAAAAPAAGAPVAEEIAAEAIAAEVTAEAAPSATPGTLPDSQETLR